MGKKAGTIQTKQTESRTKKSIGSILVKTLVPVTAVGIIIIIAFLSIQAKNTILKLSTENLQSETVENAEAIGNTLTSVTSTIEEYANTLESIPLATHDDIYNYILPSHDIKAMNTSGIYIGFSDNSYIFTDGTTVDADWVATERDWYKQGINYDTLTATEPYLDVSPVICALRSVEK